MQSTLERKPRAKGATSGYNPNTVRRRERLVEVDASNIAHLLCYSLTRKSPTRDEPSIEHRIEVDLTTGECHCSCEHFHYRCAQSAVTLENVAEQGCKHLHRAAGILERHNLIPVEFQPAADLQLEPVAQARATAGPKCPKCLCELGEIGDQPYCFACGEWINL